TLDAQTLADPSLRIDGSRFDPAQQRYTADPGYYGNYLRVYVPGGSLLQDTRGTSGFETLADGGFYVMAGFLAIDAQQQAQASFSYRPAYEPLPGGRYRLRLFKQGGVAQIPWQVIVHLPPGMHAIAVPAGAV